MDDLEGTVPQVAKLLRRTSQAVYAAIKSKRLKGFRQFKKGAMRWFVDLEDLKRYKKDRYRRELKRNPDGSLAFDPEKGQITTAMVAEILGRPMHRIYSLVKRKKIPFTRHGSTYVFLKSDIEKLKEKYAHSKLSKIR